MDKGGGGYHVFPSEVFCLTVPKKFVGVVGEPFGVSENLGYRKILCIRGISRFSVRGVARFSVDYFMSHSTETFVGEPFSVSIISDIEKFYAQERYITIFCRNFFVSKYRKISSRNPSVLQKIPGIEKFYE